VYKVCAAPLRLLYTCSTLRRYMQDPNAGRAA
jgi:hypothetical protein